MQVMYAYDQTSVWPQSPQAGATPKGGGAWTFPPCRAFSLCLWKRDAVGSGEK